MSNWTRDHKIGFLGAFLAIVSVVVSVIVGLFTPEIREFFGFNTNLLSYDNTAQGIKIKYPDNWEKQEELNAINKEVVQFISPKESEADFQERLIVQVEKTDNQTLDEYTKLSKQEILKLDKNAKIIQEGASTLASKNGYRVVYTTKKGNQDLKKLEVWTLKNDKAYFVTYVSEARKYEQFLPAVEKMIKSLEVQDTN